MLNKHATGVTIVSTGSNLKDSLTMERNTRQRMAIRRALEKADRPLSPQEVLLDAQNEVGSLGIATVYRTLSTFEKEGWIIAVQLPGDPARYEMIGKGHHHHFRCRKCGRVFDVNGCLGDGSTILPDGYILEGHELLLFGLCEECANKR